MVDIKRILIIVIFLLISISYAYSNEIFEVDIPDTYNFELQADDDYWMWSEESADGTERLFVISVVEFDETNTQNINSLDYEDQYILIEHILGEKKDAVKDSFIKTIGENDYFVVDTEEDGINVEYYALFGEKNIYILASTSGGGSDLISNFIPKDKIPGSSLKEKRIMTYKICGPLFVLILIAGVIIDVNMKKKGMTGVVNCYIKMWKNTFKIKERTSRKNYWIAIMIDSLITISFILIINIMGAQRQRTEPGIIFPTIFVIIIFISMIPKFTMRIRRLHDIGQGGTTYLVILFPIFGYILLTILMILKGNEGINKYGEEDKEVLYDSYGIF